MKKEEEKKPINIYIYLFLIVKKWTRAVHYAEVGDISKGNPWQKSVYSKGG